MRRRSDASGEATDGRDAEEAVAAGGPKPPSQTTSGASSTPHRQPRAARTPTIHDVAKRAGVAASTVSRALSRPDRVSKATRARILEVAESMGFRPSPIARALPSGRTMTLGLLVPDITNPFFLDLIRGAEKAAAAADRSLVLADTEESPEREATLAGRMNRAVDGFVLVSSRRRDDELRETYTDAPLVVVNRRVPPVPGVIIDTGDGARRALHHLAGLGHRRVAYLAGPATSWSNGQRWEALRAASRHLGSTLVRIDANAPTVAGGEDAADRLLAERVTAVVTFNDLLAIGVLRRFQATGVDVPGQVSVLGCDDIFGADFCHPPLTTLAAPIEEAGRRAVELLLDELERDDPARRGASERHAEIVLPTRLVVRKSTAPVAESHAR